MVEYLLAHKTQKREATNDSDITETNSTLCLESTYNTSSVRQYTMFS